MPAAIAADPLDHHTAGMSGVFRWGARYGLVVLIAFYLLEGLFFVTYARLNLDEGIYLAAGRLVVSEGAVPYRDFPLSQGPVVLYVYGLAAALFGSSVLVGRLVSFLASLLTVGGSVWLARRVAGRGAAALVLGLTMLCFPLLWGYTTVKTQPLATPLLLLSVVVLCRQPRSALGWAAAPTLLVWATGLRLTNGLALLAVCLLVAFALRHSLPLLLRTAAIVLVHGLLALGIVFLVAPARTIFHLFIAPSTRGQYLGLPEATSFEEGLRLKLGFFLSPDTSFFPISLLGAAVAISLIVAWKRGWRPQLALPLQEARSLQLVLLALAVLVYLPHLGLDHGFPSYFVMSAALLCPAAGMAVSAWSAAPRATGVLVRWLVAIMLVSTAVITWAYHDSWLALGDPSLPRLRQIAAELRSLAPDQCTILTLQTSLAAQADCRVFPGLEYSLFSYFPSLSTEEAERHGVLNYELLNRRIGELEPEFVVLSLQGLPVLTAGQAIGAPSGLRRLPMT